jgi:hypothetical protein
MFNRVIVGMTIAFVLAACGHQDDGVNVQKAANLALASAVTAGVPRIDHICSALDYSRGTCKHN